MSQQAIVRWISQDAPPKPVWGAPCNGCGVCCAWQPCPLGVVLTGRRDQACVALRWDPAARVYRCGAITEPGGVLRQRLPPGLRALARPMAPVLSRLARRWVAVGVGCDCHAHVEPAAPDAC